MSLLWRQILTLIRKNIIITLQRRWLSTPLRALLLPLLLVILISLTRNFLSPSSNYGIGSPRDIRSLSNSIQAVSGGRDRVVFVTNGHLGGEIEDVVADVATSLRASGVNVETTQEPQDVGFLCRGSSQGTSKCIAAIEFHSSPNEGEWGLWNYTLRADGALGVSVDVDGGDNDAQVYTLPLQHAIDFAIGRKELPQDSHALQKTISEYPFTTQTNKERDLDAHARFMGNVISILATGFYIAMVGVVYHATGLIAEERESGMAQLLDTMMPNRAAWQPRFARLASHHTAFSLLYLPGWVAMGLVLGVMALKHTSVAIPIVLNILCGLSFSSFAVFAGALFREAQLSGIVAVIVSLALAIIAQVARDAPGWVIGILACLFPPANYIFAIISVARWESEGKGADLLALLSDGTQDLPIIVFWAFALLQIFLYTLLANITDKMLFEISSRSRKIDHPGSPIAVNLQGFSKEYQPSWSQKMMDRLTKTSSPSVLAVDSLSLQVHRGQVAVLLGANGSGKSTTLDAIAGMHSASAGTITLSFADRERSFGHCPQKNVLWPDVTAEEHVKIFDSLKSVIGKSSSEQVEALLHACGLLEKGSTLSQALSGGQKRRLQLALMFSGGSTICCVDEVSSGVDPLSRRHLWDILLAERGRRTMLLTTHYLDEADVLADRVAIMSRGSLMADGTAAELKQQLGFGYRVRVPKSSPSVSLVNYRDILHEDGMEDITYFPGGSSDTAKLLRRLEHDHVTDYQVNGPTLEDVFLRVAAEAKADSESVDGHNRSSVHSESAAPLVSSVFRKPDSAPPPLLDGQKTDVITQSKILFMKRLTLLKRNITPYLVAIMLPIITAGIATIFVQDLSPTSCNPSISDLSDSSSSDSTSPQEFKIVAGPEDQLSEAALDTLSRAPPGAVTYADSLEDFYDQISQRASELTPGGFFLGDEPTFAWRADGPLVFGHIIQGVLDIEVLNVSIASDFQPLDIPSIGGIGDQLIFTAIVGLSMAVFPAFLGLYPTIERQTGVRSMHYSNGVSALPLWLSYLGFDFLFTLLVGSIAAIIFQVVTNIWYHLGYVFLIFILYGLASTLLAYVVSLFSASTLAGFAFAAVYQSGAFLVFLITYVATLTYVDASNQGTALGIAYYVLGAFAPICSLSRALYITLNMFGVTCKGREIASYPGAIDVYGAPILYLFLQSLALFTVLIIKDAGFSFQSWSKNLRNKSNVPQNEFELESGGAAATSTRKNGLVVSSLTKKFKKNTVVDDISFQVQRDECFALLGPNGAGKTTCISMIRGDLAPSSSHGRDGEILVDGYSVLRQRGLARSRLGVCPQIDPLDRMTVLEHLKFYAEIRGVTKPQHNIDVILDTLGLREYANRLADGLSGGNKRKLALGIALMGNPSILLLDEPSSGMDAASMRSMWRILSSVTNGRSLLLTTHSMEEADALAGRAGILSRKMLAVGTTEELRRRFADRYVIHLVHQDAPHTEEQETRAIMRWVGEHFPEASIQKNNCKFGQIRFEIDRHRRDRAHARSEINLADVFEKIEFMTRRLGIQHYSVSRATLEQVFMRVLEGQGS